ncbi:MAG: DNA-binding protein HU [Gammaproteobacteria bacterium]|nr:MAG: DNA-binding protein HU [Gammaproteobacteria bacterium]
MNKTELTDAVAESTGLTKADAARSLDAVLSSITASLANGEQVGIVGFGTFLTRDRKARTGRNPQTGAEIQIAAATVPAFKPGKALKDAVN